MYRTYELKGNEEYVISKWDGDCTSHTVCKNEKEYEEEKARLRKIDEEYRKAKEYYLKHCDTY